MCLLNFQQLTIKLLALLTLIKLMQLSPDFLHPGAALRRLFLQLGAPGLGFPHALQLLRGVVRVPSSSAAIAVQDKLGAPDYLSAAQTIAFGAAFLSLRRLPPLQLGIISIDVARHWLKNPTPPQCSSGRPAGRLGTSRP